MKFCPEEWLLTNDIVLQNNKFAWIRTRSTKDTQICVATLHTYTRRLPSSSCTYKRIKFRVNTIHYYKQKHHEIKRRIWIEASKNLLHRSKQIPRRPRHKGSCLCQVPTECNVKWIWLWFEENELSQWCQTVHIFSPTLLS